MDKKAPYMKGVIGFLQTIDPLYSPDCTPADVHQAWKQLPLEGQRYFAAAYAQYCESVRVIEKQPSVQAMPQNSRLSLVPKADPQAEQGWQLSSVCFGLVVYVVGEMLVKAITLLSPTLLACCLVLAVVCGAVKYWPTIRQWWHPPEGVKAGHCPQVSQAGYRLGRAPVTPVVHSVTDSLRTQVSVSEQDRMVPKL